MTKPDLITLHGRTIERIDSDRWRECLVIQFTDGTKWVLVAEQSNCAGARMESRILPPDE